MDFEKTIGNIRVIILLFFGLGSAEEKSRHYSMRLAKKNLLLTIYAKKNLS